MTDSNYNNPCHITIYKGKDDNYTLRYEDEGYEYFCSAKELMIEVGEHIKLMKGVK